MRFWIPLIFIYVFPGLSALAAFRTWTDTTGRKVEAELVSQTEVRITVKLKNGRETVIEKGKLSQADQDFLKAAAVPAADGISAKAAVFTEVKIDKRAWKRLSPPRDLKITTVDFSNQLETPHFLIAGGPKIRVEVMEAYAEMHERLYAQVVRDLPGVESHFRKARLPVWIEADIEELAKFAEWANGLEADSVEFGERARMRPVTLQSEYAASLQLLEDGYIYRNDSSINHLNLKEPDRLYYTTLNLSSLIFHEMSANDDCSMRFLRISYAYYVQGTVCGNITTTLSYGENTSDVEGFRNGRAWPATIKKILNSPFVKPGVETLLKTVEEKAQPKDIGIAYGFFHWCLRDPVRHRQFNAVLDAAVAADKTPDPESFAKGFGYDSVEAFDADFTAFLKSDQFK